MSILVNGVNYSWGHITLTVFGVPIIGITKISYKRKQVKENHYGHGNEPISRGTGRKEYEGNIELYMDEWKQIIALAPNNDPTQIPKFPISVVFSGDGVPPTIDTLLSCEFTEDDMNASEGDTKVMVSVPLIIGGINRSA